MSCGIEEIPPSGASLVEDSPAFSQSIDTCHFRHLIPAPDHPNIDGIAEDSPLQWVARKKETAPAVAWLIERFSSRNIPRPFRGITCDGNVIPGLYRPVNQIHAGSPTVKMVDAATELLSLLDEVEKARVCYDIDSDEYRVWSNPELYINPGGVRLEETRPEVRAAVHRLLKITCSPSGYQKIVGACLMNGFLGHLVNGPRVLNEHSYNFRLFGTPSIDAPWGYTFFGHHLCVNVFVCGENLVIGPTFFGAEPVFIDEGPHTGLRLFSTEEIEGLRLMQQLTPELQRKAQIFDTVQGDRLPRDRWNPFDERHRAGAYKDNCIIPYEGACAQDFTSQQQDRLIRIIEVFNECLPAGSLAVRMQLVRDHLNQTYFCWYGSFGDGDPYYYRIQSPVALCEFDFHAGIFLTNVMPAKCHIHTINRLPNGGDYGRVLLREWRSQQVFNGT